jgi:hypothetical protein
VILVGCASQQLNYNALDVASTIDSFYMQQVLTNLIKIKEQEYAIPAQVAINTGTIATSNQLTGGFSAPLNDSVAVTNQLARTVAASSSITNTVSDLVTKSNMGLSAGATNVATQQYIFWPIYSDADQLRRLQYLYRYAVGNVTYQQLLCRYPVPELDSTVRREDNPKTGIATKGLPTEPRDSSKDAEQKTQSDDNDLKKIFVRDAHEEQCPYNANGDRWKYVSLRNPDPSFLHQPGCVLCDFGKLFKKDDTYVKVGTPTPIDDPKTKIRVNRDVVALTVNEKLMPNDHESEYLPYGAGKDWRGKINWLFIVGPNETVPKGDVTLFGQYHGYSVYLGPNADPKFRQGPDPDAGISKKKFYDLMLFILEASLLSNQPTGGKGSPSRNGPQPTISATVGRM